MNTQPTTSSFIVRAAVLLLTVLTTTGSWAQSPTTVSTEDLLNKAITDGATNIQLTEDIKLNKFLNINGITVTIDLNGHRLYRELDSSSDDGHIFWVHANGNVGGKLTINDSSNDNSGTIEGGYAPNGGGINVWPGCSLTVSGVTFQNNSARDCGGAIFVREGATVTISNATFKGNSAGDHGGAVWNNGTLTATNSSFTNNIAYDVGAIYNSVYTENDVTYSGTATLTGCTFTGNVGTTGAGALANALGDTEMTIIGGTITGNTAGSRGGGIWNGGTLNMKGKVTVTGNTKAGGGASNVFLKSGKVITVAGALTESSIGVDLESVTGTFTSGYKTYHDGVVFSTLFKADHSDIGYMELDDDGDVCLIPSGVTPISYIERSWDDTNKEVISKEKSLKCNIIGYDAAPAKGQYKEVTNPPASSPNEWFEMGGYSTTVPEYYVVRENVNRETIVVQGSDVHLILCDNATLTLTGGLKLEGDNKLYIHSQSYGGAMGRLMVTTKYSHSAGIGSAFHNYKENKVGELVIHGGHIEAEGGKYSAGIGSTNRFKIVGEALCKSVTVYGGYVRARGGTNAAGIGGGQGVDGEDFILYDGTVIAEGDASGVGGGQEGNGGNVTIYGGSLTATGGGGAGIGSGYQSNGINIDKLCGGTFTIFDGTVIANGGGNSAGIGGGYNSGGAEVKIYDGTVIATGGKYGSGIGGGEYGFGGTVTISGGTVTATGGESGSGIGGGYHGRGGTVTISSGTVTAIGDEYSAGIGGGYNNNGGTITISGGTVTATGGGKAAGIGSGCYGGKTVSGGTITISGGTVTATGGEKAAGIGGGYKHGGDDVTISGGTVIAKAGNQGGEGNRAIGPGQGNDKYGTLTIDNAMMVGAGNNGSVERIYDADERKNACWYRSYAELSPCTHPSGITFTINDCDTHTSHCKHCTVSETAEHFNSDGNGTCICGYNDGEEYHTITIATSSNGSSYEGVGVMANVGNDKPYTLPVCSTFPVGYDFAGWVVNPQSHENGIQPNEGETLLPAGENITVTGNVTIFARYRALEISLADDGDNGEKLYTYKGRKAARVTLTGRKLWKDGDWNTLCLPFDVSDADLADGIPFTGTPLEGAIVKTLESSDFANGTLTLNFSDNLTTIEAGTPYIVKWSNTTSDNIENPKFTDVTIVETTTNVETDFADFVGNYSPRVYTDTIQNVLFLGAGNTLYYPQPTLTNPNAEYDAETNPCVPVTIGACRAVFLLKNGLVCGEPAEPASGINNFVLNFGGEETGITEISNLKSQTSPSTSWFTIDGRKLNGKPISKGIYINNGRKVVIK